MQGQEETESFCNNTKTAFTRKSPTLSLRLRRGWSRNVALVYGCKRLPTTSELRPFWTWKESKKPRDWPVASDTTVS